MTGVQRYLCAVFFLVNGFIGGVNAATDNDAAVRISPRCSTDAALFVITGDKLAALLGAPVDKISFHRVEQSGLKTITYQIDRRDKHNRYQIEKPGVSTSRPPVLDENDEVVLMLSDIGQRRTPATSENGSGAIEIELKDGSDRRLGWVYARTDTENTSSLFEKLIEYDAAVDSIKTDRYFIAFSRKTPFIINTVKWPLKDRSGWSHDVLDTMKLQHRGKLFKLFKFRRTNDDYRSELVAVKEGPLRIIRRTKNRVRVLWKLKSPKLYVDYVVAPDGFVMDTIIDIPFKIGLFFSNVDTISTIDWDDNPDYPKLKVTSLDGLSEFNINGQMNAAKEKFNQSNDEGFLIRSDLGSMRTRMLIPEDFPIKRWLYIVDAKQTSDPPEQVNGQYGNIGFRTTGWEKIDTKVHHLKFDVCVQ